MASAEALIKAARGIFVCGKFYQPWQAVAGRKRGGGGKKRI